MIIFLQINANRCAIAMDLTWIMSAETNSNDILAIHIWRLLAILNGMWIDEKMRLSIGIVRKPHEKISQVGRKVVYMDGLSRLNYIQLLYLPKCEWMRFDGRHYSRRCEKGDFVGDFNAKSEMWRPTVHCWGTDGTILYTRIFSRWILRVYKRLWEKKRAMENEFSFNPFCYITFTLEK